MFWKPSTAPMNKMLDVLTNMGIVSGLLLSSGVAFLSEPPPMNPPFELALSYILDELVVVISALLIVFVILSSYICLRFPEYDSKLWKGLRTSARVLIVTALLLLIMAVCLRAMYLLPGFSRFHISLTALCASIIIVMFFGAAVLTKKLNGIYTVKRIT